MLTPEEIAAKQKQRNGLMLNANKEITKAKTILGKSPVESKAAQLCLLKLKDYHTRVCQYNDDIQLSLTGDAQDKDIQKMSDADDIMLDTIVSLEVAIESRKEERMEARDVVPSTDHNASSASSTESSRVRLPKIELRSYGGDPLKWDEFWDYYDVTFHSNNNIPVIEKFTYLREILTDDALRVVDGYRLTAANYDEVIKALKDRFGDTEVAIFHHFDSMLSLSTSSGDVNELQRVFDTCEAHIRSLKALGLSEETFGKVFVPILLSKVPGNVRVELIRKKGRGAWSLSKLREHLSDEIYARDMSKRTFGAQSNSKTSQPSAVDHRNHGGNQHKGSNHSQGRNQSTASAMPQAEGTTGRKPPLPCVFCKGQHFNNRCTKYSTAAARRKQLNGQCFACLKIGHDVKSCRSKKPCFYCLGDSHHQALCAKQFPSGKGGESTQLNVSSGSKEASTKSGTASIVSQNGYRGVLQTAVADVTGGKATLSARHMLDTGSDNSYISNKLARQIGARCIGSDTVSLAGFADTKRRQKTHKIFEFDIRLRNGDCRTLQAYGTDVIICSIDKLAFDPKKYPVLQCLPLAEPLAENNEHVPVDILVGGDYYYDIVKSERIPLQEGLWLLDTELGYIYDCWQDKESNFDLERFWKLEEIGVKEPPDKHEDESALASFSKTVYFDESEGRYMVKWPFKEDCPPLPDNFGLAFGRLKSLTTRATGENGLLEKCQEIFDDQLSKGIIEEAPSKPEGPIVHYLPHHAVITPKKTTTKVRVVYDASSKVSKTAPSLNDCLHRGPVLLENLCGLLLRFRLHPIGVISDIEKAFLQVGLQKEDRDVVRFLWWRDLSKPFNMSNLVRYRFRRVCFGAKSSSFLLSGTVVVHLNKVDTPVSHRVKDNLYVDNVIDSQPTIDSALSYYKEAKAIFTDASMNLREWQSNDPEFMQAIPTEDRGDEASAKVLGLHWDLSKDPLSCDIDPPKATKAITKRFVLHSIAKVYDPCGFFTPVSSNAKFLMQELWQKGYDWDSPISDDLVERWESTLANLQSLKNCCVPRYCAPNCDLNSPIDLHVFCDASAKAYCAAVYIVGKSDSGPHVASLVFSKCRLSPLKRCSIPRLELMAATIGVRLLEFVSEELRLPIGSKYLWSDSQCVLHWIVGKPVSLVFVRNRINEIKKPTGVEYRYVPTSDNPADIPTRGLDASELMSSKLWWSGPSWLIAQDKWPHNPDFTNDVWEKGARESVVSLHETNNLAVATKKEVLEYPLDVNTFSSMSKLLRVTAWMLRFINNARVSTGRKFRMKLRNRKVCSFLNARESSSHLLARDLKAAKTFWEKVVQQNAFPETVNSLDKTVALWKSLGPLSRNSDGVICCQGRLANSDLLDAAKNPRLLPSGNAFTRLVIADYHQSFGHVGVKQTLAEVRCEYWVVQGRSEVKYVLHRCLLCRRQKGGPYQIPAPPDLPDFRSSRSPPFSTVGIDYLGPLLIFHSDGSKQKVWISLFTCAVTRAVHLEVVTLMDSHQFLLCFQRFVSFYGCPDLVVSDNAGQFESSRRVLHQLWREACQSRDVQDFCAAKQIGWKFIPESAPWMGGFYERLVGVVKSALKASIDRRKLSLVELQTVVYEVCAIVNSRPLVHVEDESGDLPLTPSHLLMRHRTIVPFISTGEPEDNPTSSQAKLISGWKRLKALLDTFWDVWRRQYLVSLRANGERITCPSLLHSYWYLYLLHLETTEAPPTGIPLSRRFLTDESLRKNHDHIAGWLQKHEIVATVDWTVKSGIIYRNIIMQLIAKNPSFREQFESTMCDEPEVSYQCPGSNRVYCTGNTERQVNAGHWPVGMNGWGHILSVVADLIKKGFHFAKMDKIGEPCFSLLQNPRPLTPNPSRTVLLIIDSYGKYLESIDNGDVVRVGGATFKMLAEEVVRQNHVLSDYQYIIVLGGLNEKRNTRPQQIESWNTLSTVLAKEFRRRRDDGTASSILICFTPPIVVESQWLTEKHYPAMREAPLDRRDGISVIDWVLNEDDEDSCPFLDADWNQRDEMFDADGIHLNNCGFRQLWRSWCQVLPGLMFVGFKMDTTSEKYRSEKSAQKRRRQGATNGSKWPKKRRVHL